MIEDSITTFFVKMSSNILTKIKSMFDIYSISIEFIIFNNFLPEYFLASAIIMLLLLFSFIDKNMKVSLLNITGFRVFTPVSLAQQCANISLLVILFTFFLVLTNSYFQFDEKLEGFNKYVAFLYRWLHFKYLWKINYFSFVHSLLFFFRLLYV